MSGDNDAGNPLGLPLAGIRILAMTQVGAGPFGALQLADFGADVIKIEDPTVGGDSTRGIPPFAEDGDSLFFQSLNRNHRGITLNLREPAGQDLLHELVAASDGFLSNLRGDQVKKLGLGYETLGEYNPRIVCCAVTGYGTTGPKAPEPAYDYLIQALCGLMSLTGEPDSPPTRAGLSIIDFTAGLSAATGLLMAILAARESGRGQDVEVSLLDSGMSLLNYVAAWTLNGGYQPERVRNSGHPSVVPCQNFQAADGWLVVMCQKEAWWPKFCAVLDRPDLAADPRFSSFKQRYANRDTLIPILEEFFRQRPVAEWLNGFRRAGIPAEKINTVEEALREPQFVERGGLLDIEHERFGTMRLIAPAIKMPGVEIPRRSAPALGADTESILRDCLGKTDADIAALRNAGAI